jgi:hypothetical protein
MQILVRDRLADLEPERERIRVALDNAREDEVRLILSRAERALADPKRIGDAVIAAFFAADKARAREDARLQVREVIEQEWSGLAVSACPRGREAARRYADRRVVSLAD